MTVSLSFRPEENRAEEGAKEVVVVAKEVATEAATIEITKKVGATEVATTETTKKVVVATEVVEITIEVSTEASRREESGRTEAASTRTEVLKVVTMLKARTVATRTRATTTA